MTDKELENFYRTGAYKGTNQLQRKSSRVSTTSVGSNASSHSDSSSGEARMSRQSSSRSKRHSETETQEMGIQTTIGRNSEGLSAAHHQSEEEPKKRERRPSTKDRVKHLFRRKSSTSSANSESIEKTIPNLPELPQGFIVKYMGKRPTKGLWGSKHTRGVVEELVDSIAQMPKGDDLPLVNLDVHYQGLAMRPHSKNKIKSFKPVQIPIQFISYGVQDAGYPRVFSFIMVKEISSQKKVMECHVYVCDAANNCKQLAACLAVAFQIYSDNMESNGMLRFSIDVNMVPEEEHGGATSAV